MHLHLHPQWSYYPRRDRMKLYFSPGTCSLSPHIALRETGQPFDLVQVDTKTKKTKAGDDFLAVNPKGMVPVLVLDNGEILTEGPAIVQYIADKKPGALIPAAGNAERYRVLEWLNYITSEIHKAFTPLLSRTRPRNTRRSPRTI
jgi:glutathione S-transferase